MERLKDFGLSLLFTVLGVLILAAMALAYRNYGLRSTWILYSTGFVIAPVFLLLGLAGLIRSATAAAEPPDAKAYDTSGAVIDPDDGSEPGADLF